MLFRSASAPSSESTLHLRLCCYNPASRGRCRGAGQGSGRLCGGCSCRGRTAASVRLRTSAVGVTPFPAGLGRTTCSRSPGSTTSRWVQRGGRDPQLGTGNWMAPSTLPGWRGRRAGARARRAGAGGAGWAAWNRRRKPPGGLEGARADAKRSVRVAKVRPLRGLQPRAAGSRGGGWGGPRSGLGARARRGGLGPSRPEPRAPSGPAQRLPLVS